MKKSVRLTFVFLVLLALTSAVGCTARPAAGDKSVTAEQPAATSPSTPAGPERVVTRTLGEDAQGIFSRQVEVVKDGDAVTTTTTPRRRAANAWVTRVIVEAHKGGKKTASATQTVARDDGTTEVSRFDGEGNQVGYEKTLPSSRKSLFKPWTWLR